MSIRYTTIEIDLALAELNKHTSVLWQIKEHKLHSEFIFADFNVAFSFMSAVAIDAEQADHHPEWSNVYNKVVIDLITHSCQGISKKDFDLAYKISQKSEN